MDVLDIIDKLRELTRSIACLATLICDRERLPVSGGDLAILLGILQGEMERVHSAVSGLLPAPA